MIRATIHRTIRQLPDGWLALETGQRYNTATGAARAIRRESAQLPDVIIVVTWETINAIGTAVVKTITDTK